MTKAATAKPRSVNFSSVDKPITSTQVVIDGYNFTALINTEAALLPISERFSKMFESKTVLSRLFINGITCGIIHVTKKYP